MTIHSQSLEKTHLECRKPLKNDILFLNWSSDNHGQKSWDKFTFVALFHTRQTNSSILVQPLSLPPSYNVGHVYTLFVQTFNIVLGGGGRKQRILKRIRVLFLKFRFKNTGINAITQVSQGILSTIVWFSRLIVKCTITMFFSLKCI